MLEGLRAPMYVYDEESPLFGRRSRSVGKDDLFVLGLLTTSTKADLREKLVGWIVMQGYQPDLFNASPRRITRRLLFNLVQFE